uniref:Putative secreted protein n=1 Tax=Anopheles darlingi TaxID=43151 RepID=A0A2M4DPI3_ANODA
MFCFIIFMLISVFPPLLLRSVMFGWDELLWKGTNFPGLVVQGLRFLMSLYFGSLFRQQHAFSESLISLEQNWSQGFNLRLSLMPIAD